MKDEEAAGQAFGKWIDKFVTQENKGMDWYTMAQIAFYKGWEASKEHNEYLGERDFCGKEHDLRLVCMKQLHMDNDMREMFGLEKK